MKINAYAYTIVRRAKWRMLLDCERCTKNVEQSSAERSPAAAFRRAWIIRVSSTQSFTPAAAGARA
jgi:hypothetical protein